MFGKNKLILTLIALGFFLALGQAGAKAIIKDSDFDGITDQAEVNLYKTDPNTFDSDGDGYADGVEVIAKTDPLDAKSTPLVLSNNRKMPLIERDDPFSWYISRISGILAFILLTGVVLLGLVQTSKSLLKYKFMSFMTAMETHRAVAWSGGIAVVIHFSSLFFDKIFQLKPIEALLPFQVVRSFRSALGFEFMIPVSLGVIAIYFIILLVLTSELRKKVIPTKAWRLIHYISFATYILFLVHAILSGTDSKEWWMIGIYATSFILVLSMFLARLYKEKLFYPKAKPVQNVQPAQLLVNANDQTNQGNTQINK
jgi:predicted ferric reductase